jgi:hypothetical protein
VAGSSGAGITRRRALAGLLLAPPALTACSLVSRNTSAPVDPLIALAAAARTDAALAAGAIAADPTLAARVQPLVDARTEHATALDAEVRRASPERSPTTPPGAPATGAPAVPATLGDVRVAAKTAAGAAGAAALDLPIDRVGLVASVAACCNAYAVVLT